MTDLETELAAALKGLLDYTGGWDITRIDHPIRIAILAHLEFNRAKAVEKAIDAAGRSGGKVSRREREAIHRLLKPRRSP